MLKTLQFDTLTAILLGLVDAGDGFLYLRMAGTEQVVNAIWSRLSSTKDRGKKYNSPVKLPTPGQPWGGGIAAEKHVRYRTIVTGLPCGMADLTMIHPSLTVAEDKPTGFYALVHGDEAPPANFFDRLNKTLSIPLKPKWAAWLWEMGQQERPLNILDKNGDLKRRLIRPVWAYESEGNVRCLKIETGGDYQTAWLQIIREKLGAGIKMAKTSRTSYRNGHWSIHLSGDDWLLLEGDQFLNRAAGLDKLLVMARDERGLHIELGDENGTT